jgi:hypothetical protein
MMENEQFRVVLHEQQMVRQVVGEGNLYPGDGCDGPSIERFGQPDPLTVELRGFLEVLVDEVSQGAARPLQTPPW